MNSQATSNKLKNLSKLRDQKTIFFRMLLTFPMGIKDVFIAAILLTFYYILGMIFNPLHYSF